MKKLLMTAAVFGLVGFAGLGEASAADRDSGNCAAFGSTVSCNGRQFNRFGNTSDLQDNRQESQTNTTTTTTNPVLPDGNVIYRRNGNDRQFLGTDGTFCTVMNSNSMHCQ